MTQWTHKALVRRMAAWLKGTKRMTVVMAELATRNSETPDVIGWSNTPAVALSTLIECKVSRADFLADGKKRFRRFEEHGMGDSRYVAVPKGLLTAGDLPDGWGLLEVDERFVWERRQAQAKPANKRNECVMLMSALRRLELSTAVYVVQDDAEHGRLWSNDDSKRKGVSEDGEGEAGEEGREVLRWVDGRGEAAAPGEGARAETRAEGEAGTQGEGAGERAGA